MGSLCNLDSVLMLFNAGLPGELPKEKQAVFRVWFFVVDFNLLVVDETEFEAARAEAK